MIKNNVWKRSSKKKAFSLIELSIVLIIIGLLIAGITGGASLIKSAELRSVIGEANQYQVAVNGFYTQYDAFPGDYNVAISSSCVGDGDDNIEYINNTAGTATIEGLCAWRQLNNSEMFETDLTYAPAASTVANAATTGTQAPGTNIPSSKVKSAGWAFDTISSSNAVVLTGTIADATYATTVAQSLTTLASGVLTNVDALSLDTKIDDGDADNGDVIGVLAACDDVSAGVYDTTDTTTSCSISFKVGI